MTLGAEAGAPKKFSFSLGKKSAEVAGAVGARGGLRVTTAKTSARPPPDAVFEQTNLAGSAPKAQALLSISGGELQVEGGEEPPPPKVIPCKNPLAKSDYRLRVIEGREPSPQRTDEENPAQSEKSLISEEKRSAKLKSEQASDEGTVVVYGLQEFDRGTLRQSTKTERTSEASSLPGPKVKSEFGSDGAEASLFDSAKSLSRTRALTDEEVAQALIAEAQGRVGSSSSRAVPLLARNASLAAIRQKHREEQRRREKEEVGKKRRETPAGEPDRELLRRELDLLPEAPAPSSLSYEAMPVEEFGLAMLRGMGFTDTISPSDANDSQRRRRRPYARAGLGSEREMDRLAEELKKRRQLKIEEEEAKHSQIITLQRGPSRH